jgi:hypothetical protein
VDGDVKLLARSVAVPRLDPDGHVGARILSPLTALFVVTDPEGKYATEHSRSQVRMQIIKDVLKTLPASLRTPVMTDELKYLVHIDAWPCEFEFAHFSDSTMSKALRRLGGQRVPPEAEIRRQLRECRDSGNAIKTVWRQWSYKPSKTQLAHALWPDLERRLQSPRSRRKLPVVDVVERALRISREVRWAREMRTVD